MKRSLQHHLSRILILVVLASGVLASAAAFYFAYAEAQEFQDDALRQIAALSLGGRSELRQLHTAREAVADPESRIHLIRLPEGPRPKWLPVEIEPGFHTLAIPGDEGDMRVFVRDNGSGNRLVVAQSTESRNEIAFNSALRTLLPLLILLPILIGLITFTLRSEFKSLRRLAEHLDTQAAERPGRLPVHDLPEEIMPFVQAIDRLLERVDKMIAGQRRFIADAAHELRTPLTALSLQVQNLAQADTREQMQERLKPLQAGIERARNLTGQLLDLARVQASESTRSEVDASALGLELIAEFHPIAEAKNIDLGMDARGLRTLTTDAIALRLIIRNGLENAIKYTPPGGQVTLTLSQREGEAYIEIIDSGCGISAGELERAFDRFHRIAEAGEGSGLGLAIVQEAANRAGGTLSLFNREDSSGLVFRYTQRLVQNDSASN